jgi:ankyrin repeat protein
MWAAYKGHTSLIAELVQRRADVHAVRGGAHHAAGDTSSANLQGNDASIMMAATKGRAAAVDQLIRLGASVDARDSVVPPPSLLRRADLAPVSRPPTAVRLQANAPLHKAAGGGHTAAIRELARGGANLDAVNAVGGSAACRSVPSSLLHGARQGGWTALMVAARWGCTATAVELVRLGADVNKKPRPVRAEARSHRHFSRSARTAACDGARVREERRPSRHRRAHRARHGGQHRQRVAAYRPACAE